METPYSVFIIFGIVLLIIATVVSNNEYVFVLVAIGLALILVFNSKIEKTKEGNPASSLNVLVTGVKYEVVDIYEKYIIVKSATDNGKLKFIGPLDFGTVITGKKYVKTAEGNLEKIE